jgi:hypothetical protein
MAIGNSGGFIFSPEYSENQNIQVLSHNLLEAKIATKLRKYMKNKKIKSGDSLIFNLSSDLSS